MKEQNINWQQIVTEAFDKVREKYPFIEIDFKKGLQPNYSLGIIFKADKYISVINTPIITNNAEIPEITKQIVYECVAKELICAGIIKTLFNPGL